MNGDLKITNGKSTQKYSFYIGGGYGFIEIDLQDHHCCNIAKYNGGKLLQGGIRTRLNKDVWQVKSAP